MSVETNKNDNRLRASKKGKELMAMYYMEAKNAAHQGKQVAWITSGGPVEPLIALDVIPVYPENHGAMVGAVKNGPELCEVAEAQGYAPDLCSYARIDIGQIDKPEGSPIFGLPRPDFIVCSNNICGTVTKWYEVLARKLDVPLWLHDAPYLHVDDAAAEQRAVAYSTAQFREYFGWLQQVTGKKLEDDRLRETVELAAKGVELWGRCLGRNKHRPAPMSCFDAFILIAPIVTLRGTQQVVDFYEMLDAELVDRCEKNIGPVPDEKLRLLWDNIPVWFAMRHLSGFLAEHGANLVCDTYTTAWSAVDLDKDATLESLAAAYTTVYLNKGLKPKAQQIMKLMAEYECDGAILHSNRSCKPYSFGQLDILRHVRETTGKPVMMLDADMTDSRVYVPAQVETRLGAFLESFPD